MIKTKHFNERVSQRAISSDLVTLVHGYGVDMGDKIVLNSKCAKSALAELDRIRKLLLRAIDKGGVTLVEAEGTLITAYNCNR